MRRLSTVALKMASSRSAASTCLLCDATYESWKDHSDLTSHKARHAVCNALVVPERHEAMMSQLWDHIQLDFRRVDEISAGREKKRRGRQTSTAVHLAEKGVLQNCVVHCRTTTTSEGEEEGTTQLLCEVKDEDTFGKQVLLGTTYMEREVLERVSRLLPSVYADEVSAVTQFCLSQRSLAAMFDTLQLQTALVKCEGVAAGSSSPPSLRLKQDEKAALLLAMMGELQLYSKRRRSRSVAEAGAADELVCNVLATHLLDNVVAELTHSVLQKIVDEGTPVWNAYKVQLKETVVQGMTLTGLPIDLAPSASPAMEPIPTLWEDLSSTFQLSSNPTTIMDENKSLRMMWTELIRSNPLEVSVSTPQSKNATFAPCIPKLSVKK